jgi:hypothetical protein
VKALPSVARTLTRAAPNLARDAKFLYGYVKDMPRTPFNTVISGHRVYATASLPLHEVKALARAHAVTVNDLVLALTAGAIRRYLTERGALPEKPLTAGVPASLRPLGDAQLNNQVVFTVSRLPTDVAEPLPRLMAAKAAGRDAKNLFTDMRELVTTNVSILGAPIVIMGIARLWSGTKAANYAWPFANLVVSNVPGPREAFYCVGAKATHYFPVSIPYHGGALNVTVQSYLDALDFGLIACSETVPDAQKIADFIVDDFAALKAVDPDPAKSGMVEKIALALAAKAAPAAKPIALKDATPPPEPPPRSHTAPKQTALAREIDALGDVTEALRRRFAQEEPTQPKKPARKLDASGGRKGATPAAPAAEAGKAGAPKTRKSGGAPRAPAKRPKRPAAAAKKKT